MKLSLFKINKSVPNLIQNDILINNNDNNSNNTNSNKLFSKPNTVQKNKKYQNLNKVNDNNSNNKNKWQILSTLCCYKCSSKKSENEYRKQNRSVLNKNKVSIHVEKSETNGLIDGAYDQKSSSFSQPRMENRSSEILTDTNVCINSPLPQVTSSTKDLPKLYPPGRILHIVRKYPRTIADEPSSKNTILPSCSNSLANSTTIDCKIKTKSKKNSQNKKIKSESLTTPIYQIIENDNKKFNELLISPRMLQDHMPDNLIKCMRAVLEEQAPKKPPRKSKLSKSDLDDTGYDEYKFKEIVLLDEPKMTVENNYKKESNTNKTRTTSYKSINFIKQYFTGRSDSNTNDSSLNLINQAPLAKQESITDISLNLDDLYFDDSINFNSKLTNETIHVTNSNNETLIVNHNSPINNSKTSSSNSNKNNSNNNSNNCNNNNSNNNNNSSLIGDNNKRHINSLKIQINCDYAESDAESNEITKNRTSTPRNNLSEYSNDDKEKSKRESFISNETNENKTNSEEVSNSLIYSFTSSSGNLQNAKGTTSSNFESSCSFSFNQTKSDIKLELNNQNNLTNTTNYPSIEKLEILKPQSKDYILCFDTSSLIDHNSSIATSNEAFNFNLEHNRNNLNNNNNVNNNSANLSLSNSALNEGINPKTPSLDPISDNLNETTDCNKIENSNSLEKNRSLGNYYDSGVDTARTLSPQIFSSNSTTENLK